MWTVAAAPDPMAQQTVKKKRPLPLAKGAIVVIDLGSFQFRAGLATDQGPSGTNIVIDLNNVACTY